MGSPEPLMVLVERLTAAMGSDGPTPVNDKLVQNTILELAMRKSFGVKDGEDTLSVDVDLTTSLSAEQHHSGLDLFLV